ncbi:MAG: 2-C-methyl-D-erythritol 4-phosphate cytidylyltransferase [Ignavibacteria bacterium]|jgi:2-C-methyl-D-erythritol 4-phosphate cytidylyltransferase|nr:2-C-methyl-D-erythritol 4-phosphate cytidylyltransferase [Ignavibacteria bacterium]
MQTSVIIPAAGLGKRIGGELPKQYIEINNIPLLVHSIKLFDNIDDVESIVIPVHSEWFSYTKDLIKKFDCKKVKEITIGGQERQESVNAGLHLKAVQESELVLVHDAVRPFASQALLNKLIEAAEEYGAVVPALKPVDTIKEVSHKGYVTKTLEREMLIQVQTPQAFWSNVAVDAYEKAAKAGYRGTDDAALVEFNGYKVYFIDGEPTNIKITTPIDLEFAKLILK